MRFAKEIEQEAKGEEVESGKEEEKTPATNEEKERQLAMMNNRLYEHMEENANKKQKRIDTLKEKAKKASAKKGGDEQ